MEICEEIFSRVETGAIFLMAGPTFPRLSRCVTASKMMKKWRVRALVVSLSLFLSCKSFKFGNLGKRVNGDGGCATLVFAKHRLAALALP